MTPHTVLQDYCIEIEVDITFNNEHPLKNTYRCSFLFKTKYQMDSKKGRGKASRAINSIHRFSILEQMKRAPYTLGRPIIHDILLNVF